MTQRLIDSRREELLAAGAVELLNESGLDAGVVGEELQRPADLASRGLIPRKDDRHKIVAELPV